jgi:hypothetical protein
MLRLTGYRTMARVKTWCAGLAVGLLCLLAGDIGSAPGDTRSNGWSEVRWPFLTDQWGTGRAFWCGAEQCGSEVYVYLRAKIGFCRCATGVSDDDEIDRVGDVELIGSEYTALASGHPIMVGTLSGRARFFLVERPFQSRLSALAVALANHCDAIVATVVAEPDILAVEERAAVEFLRSDTVQLWAKANTGLE